MRHQTRIRTISGSLLVALAGSAAGAQTLWNSASGGLWGTPANWSPADVPNSAGEQARFMLPGVYQVSVAATVSVGGVEIFNSGTTVAIQPGEQLSILGGVWVNEGAVLINPPGTAAATSLAVNVNTSVSGSGEVRLNGLGLDARLEAQIGATLTNLFPHVIRGRGRVVGVINNQSSIIGDVPGQDLEISFQVTQSGAGECLADGGNIGLQSGARITGGVMRSLNGGVWRTQTGSCIIDGITNEGDGQVIGGTVLRLLAGGVENNGTITLNPAGTSADATMDVLEDATHSGTGVLRLNGLDLDAQLNSQPGMTLTNQATIAGRGRVTASVINEGLILADITGQVLTINGPVVQTATGVCRADDGFLGLSSFGSITGGTLETSGAGRWQARAGSPDVSDVTNLGMGEVIGGAVLELLSGGMTNEGVVLVNPSGTSFDAAFRVAESSTLDGAGTLRLNGTGLDAQLNGAVGATLTHGVDHAIAGRGRVSATVSNFGTIVADNPLSQLEIAGPVTQGPAGVCAANGAVLGLVAGGSISGGFLDSSGGGVVQASSGTSTISGVTNVGSMAVAPGAILFVGAGGIINNGECTINPPGTSADAVLRFTDSAPMGGSGRIVLAGTGLDAQFASDPGVTVIHGASHTIAGRGRLSATLSNAGLIDGDTPLGSLEISGAITQTGLGRVHASAGTVGLVSGGSIAGGLLDGTGAGVVSALSGTSLVRDVEIRGVFEIRPSALLQGAGSIVNNGTIRINPPASPADALFTSVEPLEISGTGEIILSGIGLDAQLTAGAGAPITLGPGQTLRGIGRLLGPMFVDGTIAPGLSVGELLSNAVLSFGNNARVEIEVASPSSFDRITGAGAYTLNGTVVVSHLPGFTPVLGNRIIIMSGSSFSGLFDDLDAPDLGGIEWKLVYFPTKVELQVRCKADLTGSSDPNDPNYGIPDGFNDASDFFYYLDLFVASDPRADLTGSSDPNDPSYGNKDGTIDASDFFFFLDIFVSACG